MCYAPYEILCIVADSITYTLKYDNDLGKQKVEREREMKIIIINGDEWMFMRCVTLYEKLWV